MSDENGKTDGEVTAGRDPHGRFVKGNTGPSRTRKGVPNRRTEIGRATLEALQAGDPTAGLPPVSVRLAALLTDKDPTVRLSAEKLVAGLIWPRGLPETIGAGGLAELQIVWREVSLIPRSADARDD